MASTLTERRYSATHGPHFLSSFIDMHGVAGSLVALVGTAPAIIMDWIFDHFNMVLLVGIALASWLKSRMDANKAEREIDRQDSEETSESPFGPDGEWQEAYPDTPAESPEPQRVPPPLVRVSPVIPVHPPPVSGCDADFSPSEPVSRKFQQDLKDRMQRVRETRAVTTGGAAATRTRVAAKGVLSTTASDSRSIAAGLKNRKELRRALVMREILGPPIGMKS